MNDNLKKYKEFFIHSTVWIFIYLIFILFLTIEGIDITVHSFYKMGFNMLIFYINYAILVPKLLIKKKNYYYFFSIIILIWLGGVLSSELFPFRRMIRRPFVEERIFDQNRPKLLFYLRGRGAILFFLIIGTMIRIFEEWNRNEKKRKEIEAQKNTTELKFLKNQLSPHFLFNSLNSIYSLTTKKSNDAPEAVITLSELMRYMLYQTNNDFVLLKSELNYIQNYIKLQRLRIVNNEKVTLNIHGNISSQKIRPLLLISFIENAFKYGTDFKGDTLIDIDIYVNQNRFKFICVNLIGSSNKDDTNSGIGLKNTKGRLELLYPDKHKLFVTEKENTFKLDLTLILD